MRDIRAILNNTQVMNTNNVRFSSITYVLLYNILLVIVCHMQLMRNNFGVGFFLLFIFISMERSSSSGWKHSHRQRYIFNIFILIWLDLIGLIWTFYIWILWWIWLRSLYCTVYTATPQIGGNGQHIFDRNFVRILFYRWLFNQ